MATTTSDKIDSKPSPTQSEAEMLLAITDELACSTSLDDQLHRLTSFVKEAIGVDRCSIFLHDPLTGELYSRPSQIDKIREIRVLDDVGIVGHVFTTGESVLIPDAYKDDRFYPAIDEKTGYKTKTILCVPIRSKRGELLGVAQALNKQKGRFTKQDLEIAESLVQQASIVLEASFSMMRMKENQRKEAEFLDVVADISSEINLGPLLQMIMSMVTKMLHAERSTLFLNDEKTHELYTEIGEGLGATKIRFPNKVGIAGTVFQTRQSVNIPYAYADLRFNPAFDKQTGFFTRSLLCVPVVNKEGKVIGVTQVLNKIGGTFSNEDESRLKAFTAQISIALENAQLFDDIQSIKNYNESILESMSNGVITFDEEGNIVTCNKSGLDILSMTPSQVIGKNKDEFFTGPNAWLLDTIAKVTEEQQTVSTMNADIEFAGEKKSVNITGMPLTSGKDESLGSMLLIEDITSEKQMKSTMSRYMDPGLAEKLLEAGEDFLGGQTSVGTVLFSDVRSFTTITEELGAQGTVALLNDYFTIMVDVITGEGGMLDKFIGDAIMAIFGTPVAHDDDPDRGVRAAIKMMTELETFNRNRAARGQRAIDHGIGLNTDQIVSGNIGSPKRMDYTVIGDGVNLAARLESACKQYGAHILVSEYTVGALKGTYRLRDIDSVIVKGKTEPVGVFEVLDFHTSESFPSMVDVLGHFRSGREEYKSGNWDRAIKSFQEALALHQGDKAAELYIERCKLLKKDPPKDWNGVWTMTSK